MGNPKEEELTRFIAPTAEKEGRALPSAASPRARHFSTPASPARPYPKPNLIKPRSATHKRKNIMLIILLVVVIIGAAFVGVHYLSPGSFSKATTSSTTQTLTPPRTTAAPRTETTATASEQLSTIVLGQTTLVTGTDGSKLMLTFTAITFTSTYFGQSTRPDHRFAVVDYTLSNPGESPINTTLGAFDLKTSEDNPYSPVLVYPLVDLGSGRSEASSIVFEISNSAVPLELRYYPLLGGEPSLVLDLRT